jgi:hypothetical protein
VTGEKQHSQGNWLSRFHARLIGWFLSQARLYRGNLSGPFGWFLRLSGRFLALTGLCRVLFTGFFPRISGSFLALAELV